MTIRTDDALLLGCAYLKEGNYGEALHYLQLQKSMYEADPEKEIPPEFLSNYGIALAYAENRFSEAVNYCSQAIKKQFYNPEFYLNLARVYQRANRRASAVSVLHKGLKIDVSHPGLLKAVRQLGVRRPPVLSFLPRGSMVNKYLGILVARLQRVESSGSNMGR
jgi:tetratricopeptide (TPR) repeat protein